jgi:chemotaxis signal transduction protein
VRSGGICFALPAGMVRQVARGLVCFPVPGAEPHLVGLAQFGGEPLAVLDLYVLVEGGMQGATQHATVILGADDRTSRSALGVAVDDALSVVTLEGAMTPAAGGGLVVASTDFDGEAVRVLNPQVLFDEDLRVGGGNG